MNIMLSILSIITVLVLDIFFISERSVFSEEYPIFTPLFLLRSILLLTSAFYFAKQIFQNLNQNSPKLTLKYLFLPALGIVFSVILAIQPELFTQLGTEDNIIEYTTAFTFLFTSVAFLVALFKSKRQNVLTKLALVTGSALFFFIAMEEISWFQRILNIETPDAFESNLQNETNIHNFFTETFENVFYFGSFLILIVLPLIKDYVFKFKILEKLDIFKPSLNVFFYSLPFVVFTFDMWNIFHIQFASLFVFVVLVHLYIKTKQKQYFILIFLLATIQVLMLLFGQNSLRQWDTTEYKEMFISVGYFVYSLEVFRKIINNEVPSKY